MVSNESILYYLSIEYKIYALCGYQMLADVKNLPFPHPEMQIFTGFCIYLNFTNKIKDTAS